MNILQTYTPSSGFPQEDLTDFYGDYFDTLRKIPGWEILIVMGEFNLMIGETLQNTHLRSVVEKNGIGIRNDRGKNLH